MKKIKFAIVFMFFAGLLIAGLGFVGIANAEQTKCPVMGLKIDEKVSTDHEGKRIYFCCKSCVDKFKEDPATYLKKM